MHERVDQVMAGANPGEALEFGEHLAETVLVKPQPNVRVLPYGIQYFHSFAGGRVREWQTPEYLIHRSENECLVT